MTALALRGTRIGQARIRASRADATSCAARCAAIVPGLDLEPAAMPPQAILCVRSLADPLPGGIDARSRQAETRPAAWEAAMRASLRDCLQRAARPVDGPVPSTADAVLFADPSELLACAARDACGGWLASRWWWRHLLSSAAFDAVVDAWREAPTYVPAALESLAGTSAAVSFVRRLSRTAALQLLDAVLRAHGVESLADEIAALWNPAGDAARRRQPVVPPPGPEATRPAATASPEPARPIAPWRDIMPAEWDRADLSPEQRTFAAICIVLRRAPSLPRRQAFKTAAIAHLSEVAAGASAWISRAAAPQPLVADVKRPRSAPDSAPADARPVHRTGATSPAGLESNPASVRQAGSAAIAAFGAEASHAPRAPETAEATSAGSAAAAAAVHSHGAQNASGLPEPSREVPRPVPQAPDGRPASTDIGAGVESGFAGAFFLLNVALDLELYRHGFAPGADLDLGVWDFVELVARDVLGDEGRDDHLWALLRDLAHPAAPWDEHEVARQDRDALLTRVREHIVEALAVEDAGRFLLARRGRIIRSPSHIDVHFSLVRHPIEIRLARLDRNPGWIPAAGTHVGFHFN